MNAPKSILLHVDNSTKVGLRLQTAGLLSETFDADLAALYAVSSFYPFSAPSAPEAAAAMRDIEYANRAAAKARFDASAWAYAARVRWSETSLAAERVFSRQARYADLMVLGQNEPGKEVQASIPPDFVQWVLIESGRPGLVIPYIGAGDGVPGKVAVVAWKNTREAAHAVSAALPFLCRSERVHVVAWTDEPEDGEANAPPDIERYLRSHGVTTTMHRHQERPLEVGDALLSMVADVGADLLVMGCYGHSRAREWVLGGVTRTVLRAMTVPVLMAH
jgi:nucleotide-binding universal stress UspA family protein